MKEVVIQPYAFSMRDAVVRHHASYYGRHWGFDARFVTQVFRELSAFVRDFNKSRDGFWRASVAGEFAGAIAIDGTRFGADEARLRWFIVPEQYQGMGVGSQLFDAAMTFCGERDFKVVHLWTFAGLDAARGLYERGGFMLKEEVESDGWGTAITEQKFLLELTRTS